MMKAAFRSTILLLALCPFSESAKLHTLISIDDFSWLATDIVVVTEGDEIDGEVTVLEYWQGDLRPGDSINIPELTRFKSEQSRHIECLDIVIRLGKCTDTTPQFVSGSRIVLFLRHSSKQQRPQEWSAIGAVWIEQGIAYGLWDGDYPWSGTFAAVGSEVTVRDTITRVSSEREGLRAALELKDVDARIQALRPFATSATDYTATVASVEINALEKASAQSRKSDKTDRLDIPVVRCTDDCAGAIFEILLKRELDFWKETAPYLKIGWWNDPEMSWDELKVYRTHFSNTLRALSGLQGARHTQSSRMVKELRAYFLVLPQLKDESLIVKACDSFLNNISGRKH